MLADLRNKGVNDVGARHVLTGPTGLLWTIEAFKSAWRRAFLASGITDDLHFHDIRGTAVTMLAEAGATVPEIASITGHSLATASRILDKNLKRTQGARRGRNRKSSK